MGGLDTSSYWKLDKADRWLDHVSDYENAIEYPGHNLMNIIRERFPINQVPEEIELEVSAMMASLKEGQDRVYRVIDAMSQHILKKGNRL